MWLLTLQRQSFKKNHNSGVPKTVDDVTSTTHSLTVEIIIIDRDYRWDGFLRINVLHLLGRALENNPN